MSSPRACGKQRERRGRRSLRRWQRTRSSGLIGLIRGLRFQVAGWSGDADLIADEGLLEDYLAALDAAERNGPSTARAVGQLP